MDVKKSTAKVLAVTITIILFCLAFFGYKQYDEFSLEEETLISNMEYIKTQKEVYFNSIISENKSKAENINSITVNDIYDRLLPYYNDDTYSLQYDITNPSSDSKLSKLFDDILCNIYVEKDTKYNKPFVISMENVVWNKSVSVVDEDSNSLDNIIYYNYNYQLTNMAINDIKAGSSNLIYWKCNNDSYDNIRVMDIHNLYDLYESNGSDALRSYELLVPIYITDSGDIFNISDVDSIGHKNKNYKLIVIQRISVYDIIIKYQHELFTFDTKIESIQTDIDNLHQRNALAIGEIVIMTIFILLGTARYQNTISKE